MRALAEGGASTHATPERFVLHGLIGTVLFS